MQRFTETILPADTVHCSLAVMMVVMVMPGDYIERLAQHSTAIVTWRPRSSLTAFKRKVANCCWNKFLLLMMHLLLMVTPM